MFTFPFDRSIPRARIAPERATASVAVLAAAGLLICSVAPGRAQQLPVPCASGACSGAAFANSVNGKVTARVTSDANKTTIDQSAQRAILNWQSFNIGAGKSVEFRQPDASAVALNRIHQASPSQIAGKLSANGQVYLINQNGIVFGAGAQVNVHSLVAASINISDQDFTNGLLAPINEVGGGRAVFTPFRDGAGNVLASGAVRIEPGAVLESASGGRIMVLAPVVENRGEVRTPDGQTILGGGNHVYLEASRDANLRGLLIEVDTQGDVAGTVTNLGRIVAERGNATLIGLTVNQKGRVTATTSVSANGSIRLLARSGAEVRPSPDISPQARVASMTGNLTLGEGSITEVLPDPTDTATTVRGALFDSAGNVTGQSRVELMGDRIVLERSALVSVPAGRVTATALKDPRQYSETRNVLLSGARSDSRIFMEAGSRIDVAGLEAVLPMERNQLEVELRGNELRDTPLQREGLLRGKKITIDIRQGTRLADVEAAIDNIPVMLAEKMTTGGTVALKSEGDVILRQGSSVDVSGGQVRFLDGYVRTTRLISGNRIYDVSSASPDLIYQAFADTYSVEHKKWGVTETWSAASGAGSGAQFYRGYLEGKGAGRLDVQGYGLVLNGELRARTAAGEFQRDPGTLPTLGRLVIGAADQSDAGASGFANFVTPGVLLRAHAPEHPFDRDDPLPVDLPLTIATPALRTSGFGRIEIYSNATISQTADAPVEVPPGGSITLVGQSLDIDGRISARAGGITLGTRFVAGEPADSAHLARLGPHAVLDARGSWVNDRPGVAQPAIAAPRLIHGGVVSFSTAGVSELASGSVIDVSGGGSIDAKGRLAKGNGGGIVLAVTSEQPLGATLRAGALGKGGSLTFAATDIVIGSDAPEAGYTALTPDFVQRGGFAAASLSALDSLIVAPGAFVDLRAYNLVPVAGAGSMPTGAEPVAFSVTGQLPETARVPVALTLSSTGTYTSGARGVTLGAGSTIVTDPKGEVRVTSLTGIVAEGRIDAPAGKITLEIQAPPQAADPGFRSQQAIHLTSSASLNAAGAAQIRTTNRGLLNGDVLPGGEVSLRANRGYVAVAQGAEIDVRGAAAALDIPGANGVAERRAVASAGGAVALSAAEGIVLDGRVHGVGGAPEVAGGSLRFNASRGLGPTAAGRVVVTTDAGTLLPSNLAPLTPLPDALNGQSVLKTALIADSGFDVLSLTSPDRIVLDAGASLAVRRSIVLDAPVLAVSGTGTAQLSAAHVALGNSASSLQSAVAAPSAGAGVLHVAAGLLDIVGNSSLQGLGFAAFDIATDVRLRGVLGTEANARNLRGALASVGTLDIRASQIYPTTLSEFAIRVHDNVTAGMPGTIRIQAGGSPAPVLSAAGMLTLEAARIEQGGVVKAPLGRLELRASERIVLADGSITSVAGDDVLVPFGLTQNQRDWYYDFNGALLDVSTPPQKSVVLRSPDVRLAASATVDLRGGGDLVAYEFVPGGTGSRDILANLTFDETVSASKPTTIRVGGKDARYYAIVPGLTSVPLDLQAYAGSDLQPLDAVYLSGTAGLPAGMYPLLPARYALLPGAFLVGAVSGFQDLQPGAKAALPGGTEVVAGYRTAIGTDLRESRWSGYAIIPSSGTPVAVNTLADYQLTSSNSYHPARAANVGAIPPRVPADAGRLVFADLDALALDGQVLTASAAGGRGAQIDIAARHLRIVAGPSTPDGSVQVDAARLSNFGAESLLLGATRTDTAGGVQLDVRAETLRADTGAALQAPEIILAATQRITLDGTGATGASLTSTGGTDASSSRFLLGAGAVADGALIRVAGGAQAEIVRDAPARARGALEVNAGARLSGGAIAVDATLSTTLDGTLVAPGGSVSLRANRLSFGETDGAGVTQGLVMSNARVASELGGVRELSLQSYDTIEFYGAATIGGRSVDGAYAIDKLNLSAQALLGFDNAGKQARIAAAELSFVNPGSPVARSGSGSGTLVIEGDRVIFGSGDKAATGFSAVQATAHERMEVSGVGALRAESMALSSPLLGVGSAANQSLVAASTGTLTFVSPRESLSGRPAALGGRITLSGGAVTIDGRIDAPAGRIALESTGSSPTDGVTLGANAAVSVAGDTRTVFDVITHAPGGEVTIVSRAGAVKLLDGSSIDVGGGQSGDAGGLSIDSARAPVLQGQLRGGAASGYRQGSFVLESGEALSGPTLARALAGRGFEEVIAVRAREGDLVLSTGDHLRARNVQLTADRGAVAITRAIGASSGAVIDASGAQSGRIELHARDQVRVAAGATLDAHATGSGERGGAITLGSTLGTIALEPGSAIDLRGGAAGEGGVLHLRAPRTGAGGGTDIAIAAIGSDVMGASRIDAEGFKVYSSGTIDAATISTTSSSATTLFNEARSFTDNVESVRLRLGKIGDPTFHLIPGIEILSTGDITLATDWSLHAWRYDASSGQVVTNETDLSRGTNANGPLEVGVLTLRAGGDLLINASLSDGFTGALATSSINDGGRSWSYRLAAGSDLASADPLALLSPSALPAGKGSVTIAAGTPPAPAAGGGLGNPPQAVRQVRTGTGSIELAAGRDLTLKSLQSLIYTAGTLTRRRTPVATGTTAVYVDGGGDIAIRAQGNIVAEKLPTDTANQLFTGWLHREGNPATETRAETPANWWIDFRYFQQYIAALGGGDVTVQAGNEIHNLSVSIPTNKAPDAAQASGGGNLVVEAGGDIKSGAFFVAQGTGRIATGGELTFSRQIPLGGTVSVPLYPVLAVGDARIDVSAVGNLTVETILNPTAQLQSVEQSSPAQRSYFYTYGADAGATLRSLAGDILLSNNPVAMERAIATGRGRTGANIVFGEDRQALFVYPPSLRAHALEGDVTIAGPFAHFPSAHGQLELLAGGNVNAGEININLSDADPAGLPRVGAPVTLYAPDVARRLNPLSQANLVHALTPVRSDGSDAAAEPARIYALNGDVRGGQFYLNKQSRIRAGRDVADVSLFGQNIDASDHTSVIAGRDVVFNTPRDVRNVPLSNADTIEVGGPGRVEVRAGRHVDLGSSAGLVTVGNLENPALPARGADLVVIAGVPQEPGYAALVAAYLERYVPGSPELEALVASLAVQRQDPALTQDQVLVELRARPFDFRNDIFFNELKLAGRARDYERGYAAIRTLFPATSYAGDLSLYFSQIRTLGGGDVDLLVPGGSVNAGLGGGAGGFSKPASELGIVAQDLGRVRAFAERDFAVNESRVFTLRGGDLLIWSSSGDIDAGKGAKTALSAPPPVILYDSNGNVSFNVQGAASGSGIRILLTRRGDIAGDADLIAPRGEVIAGDAGIGSAGNLNIAAVRVVGAENIQAAGRSSGVPVADTSGLASGLTSLGSATTDATRSTDQAARAVSSAQSAQAAQQGFRAFLITVEVLGFGN